MSDLSVENITLYPLVVINDRYNGVYSGAQWTAWEDYPDAIPEAVFGDDDSCFDFWLGANKDNIGFGDTPEQAIQDLKQKKVKYYNAKYYNAKYDKEYTL